MTFPQSCRYLNSFINYEIHLDQLAALPFPLERFEQLLKALGSPHKNFKAIHVAGTKGKGSTSTFAANILKHFGYTVGLYTSPHLWDVRERIRRLVPGGQKKKGAGLFSDCISEKEFCELLSEIKPALEKARQDKKFGPPTYFEVLTALAFCYFDRSRTDYVVLETGLGGRLDATNAVDSLVCGIAPISLEHTQILGDTLAAIAGEKAAIIKNGRQTVIVAPQDPAAMEVITARCRKMKAKTLFVGKDILCDAEKMENGWQMFRVQTPRKSYDLRTQLLGEYQCENAAMAIGLVEKLFDLTSRWSLVAGRWEKAVDQGIKNTTLPGRFEVVSRAPPVILDVAHTPESIAKVGETIRKVFPDKKIIAVLGLSKDKDQVAILKELKFFSDAIILTKANHPRAADFEPAEVKDVLAGTKYFQTTTVDDGLTLALNQAQADDVILVTGSFFVVGEVKKI